MYLLTKKNLQQIIKELFTPPPVYIFQMGKVGSQSVKKTLESHWKGIVVHSHNFFSLTPYGQIYLRFRLKIGLTVYVICPVRDPLSRNVSAFFQTFETYTGLKIDQKKWTTDELLKLFIEKYPHNNCLEWFDWHFRNTFNIDIYKYPFPRDKKWSICYKRPVKALVYRTDLNHDTQLKVISDFLSINIEKWEYANETASKEYAEIYEKFCSSVALPLSYRQIMNKSRFSKQFWTKEEIAESDQKWSNSKYI